MRVRADARRGLDVDVVQRHGPADSRVLRHAARKRARDEGVLLPAHHLGLDGNVLRLQGDVVVYLRGVVHERDVHAHCRRHAGVGLGVGRSREALRRRVGVAVGGDLRVIGARDGHTGAGDPGGVVHVHVVHRHRGGDAGAALRRIARLAARVAVALADAVGLRAARGLAARAGLLRREVRLVIGFLLRVARLVGVARVVRAVLGGGRARGAAARLGPGIHARGGRDRHQRAAGKAARHGGDRVVGDDVERYGRANRRAVACRLALGGCVDRVGVNRLDLERAAQGERRDAATLIRPGLCRGGDIDHRNGHRRADLRAAARSAVFRDSHCGVLVVGLDGELAGRTGDRLTVRDAGGGVFEHDVEAERRAHADAAAARAVRRRSRRGVDEVVGAALRLEVDVAADERDARGARAPVADHAARVHLCDVDRHRAGDADLAAARAGARLRAEGVGAVDEFLVGVAVVVQLHCRAVERVLAGTGELRMLVIQLDDVERVSRIEAAHRRAAAVVVVHCIASIELAAFGEVDHPQLGGGIERYVRARERQRIAGVEGPLQLVSGARAGAREVH